MANTIGPDDDSETDLPADASLEAMAEDEGEKTDKEETAVEEENEGAA